VIWTHCANFIPSSRDDRPFPGSRRRIGDRNDVLIPSRQVIQDDDRAKQNQRSQEGDKITTHEHLLTQAEWPVSVGLWTRTALENVADATSCSPAGAARRRSSTMGVSGRPSGTGNRMEPVLMRAISGEPLTLAEAANRGAPRARADLPKCGRRGDDSVSRLRTRNADRLLARRFSSGEAMGRRCLRMEPLR
jgi:hypothetical protein